MAATVLVVEDEECMRDCAVDVIADCGFHVRGFASAEAALLFLEKNAQDVEIVFTDNSLAGDLDGVGLAAIVQVRWPDIRVLVTSGNEAILHLLPEGAGFLPKPWRTPQVIHYLDLHQSRGNAAKGDTALPDKSGKP